MNRVLLLLLLLPTLAFGAISNQPISIASVGEPLFVVARTIERSLGSKVVLRGTKDDQEIKGSYVGKNGKEFLDQFTAKNGLVWAEQGGQVVIAPAGTDLSATLAPTAKVSAPSTFTRVLHDPKDPNKLGLMIFQIHNAWADDRKLGNQTVTGVARLFGQFVGIPVARVTQSGAPEKPAPVERAPRTQESNSQQAQILSLFKSNVPVPATNAESGGGEPNIGINVRGVYADGRLNAILVRDYVANFEHYKSIVQLLDRPTDMVQLDALIVDISQSKAIAYGINWSFGESTLGSAGASIVLGQAAGARLLANLKASQQAGESQTVSVPSVVTLNNVEATFSSTRNQYISVAGFQDSSLNKVTTETALRVTPLIANESANVPYNERRVKLLVNVQDGDFEETKLGQAPTTKQSQLTTQAVVRSGDMLVVGGQIIKRKSEASDGVPVLSTLPVVGALFGTKSTKYEEFLRVYIIRTRILGEDSASANEAFPINPRVAGVIQ